MRRRAVFVLAFVASLSGCWATHGSEYDYAKGPNGSLIYRDTPNNWRWFRDETGYMIKGELRKAPAQGMPNWNMHWVTVIEHMPTTYEHPQKFIDYTVAARRSAGLPELDFNALRLDGRTWQQLRERNGIGDVAFAWATPAGCVYRTTPDTQSPPDQDMPAVITENHGACERVFQPPYIAIDTADRATVDRFASLFFGERQQAFADALGKAGTWPLDEAVRTHALPSGSVFDAQGATPSWLTGDERMYYKVVFLDLDRLTLRVERWQ